MAYFLLIRLILSASPEGFCHSDPCNTRKRRGRSARLITALMRFADACEPVARPLLCACSSPRASSVGGPSHLLAHRRTDAVPRGHLRECRWGTDREALLTSAIVSMGSHRLRVGARQGT